MKNIISLLILSVVLICTGCNSWSSNGALIELSPEGKEVSRKHMFENPSYFTKTPDGNILVADLGVKQFVELNDKNDVLWSSKGLNPVSIQKTKDGTYLVTNQSGDNSFQEISKGDAVWEYSGAKSPNRAIKLDNGHYILVLTLDNVIKEIDKNKNVIWSTPKDMLKHPYDIQLLKNGNYLITDFDYHRVIETDKNFKILWEQHRGLMHPVSAVKLDNGLYVIADRGNKRVIFVDKDGVIKTEIKDIEPRSLTVLPNGNVGLAAVKPKK